MNKLSLHHRRPAVTCVVLALALYACSNAPQVGDATPTLSSGTTNTSNTGQPANTLPTPSTLLIVCDVGQGWEELDPSSGRVVSQINQSPDISSFGSCENPSFGTFDTVGALGASSILQSLSPSLQDWAGTEGTGTGTHACYTPVNSSNCIDDSGVSSSNFSQQSVQDSGALFNPVTGDLWWTRNGDLMSNQVPGGAEVNNGPGTLISFTPQGEPVPFQYYDSPSGNVRLIENDGNGYYGDLEYGPSSSLTSTCLQSQQGMFFQNGNRAICGGTPANALADACDSNSNNGNTAGLSNDTTVICYNNSGLDAVPLDLGGASSSPYGTSLIPTTTQSIVSALVSPNGGTAYFLASSGSTGLTLYSAPSDGTGATTAPTQITTLGSNDTSGSNSGPYLLGWYTNGQIVG
jgi:hypothetical protein